MTAQGPFLRIPPFPGAKAKSFAAVPGEPTSLEDLAQEIRRQRVGGTYWASQPLLPGNHVLARSQKAAEVGRAVADGRPLVLWIPSHAPAAPDCTVVVGDCDPWHMLASATALIADPDDEVRLIASLLGVPVHEPVTGKMLEGPEWGTLAQAIGASTFENPFTGEVMTPLQAAQLCGFWRRLIDSNRGIGGGYGFAFWKQAHVAPLLWNGSDSFRFVRTAADVAAGSAVAVWRAKAAGDVISDLERSGSAIIEVEDGFLRSRGLGADCVPPLSITVDNVGAYFDPSRPSDLENLLEEGGLDAQLLARAGELRQLIVDAGIGKYEQGGGALQRRVADRRHILVPGQVEDDRAVQMGGCGLVSNLELLKKVRGEAPDAYILYKPHPDVLAGHRRGAVPDRACLQFADEMVGDLPIASLIAMADEVHVNTSLAGFEALLRGKSVTTYGVPFYAGWGLTKDLGPVPLRRTARRTLDELVAVTLLIYPRYVDPLTGLPCPAEVVVARLSSGEQRDAGLLVGMRRLQGKLMRRLRSLVQ
jgi:capsular polysaccharide export protein